MRTRIICELLLGYCLAVFVSCSPSSNEKALQDEIKRLQAANQDLLVKYNQAIQEVERLKGEGNPAGSGGSGKDPASLQDEVKRLRAANEDLVVKYNRAIQEILKLRGQANSSNEKTR